MSVNWFRLTAMAWLLVSFIVAPPATAQPLRVGGKAFTEQLLMVELTSEGELLTCSAVARLRSCECFVTRPEYQNIGTIRKHLDRMK